MLNGIYDMQVLYPRVEEAISEKMQNVKKAFNDMGMGFPPHDIFLRVFKDERLLELWGRGDNKGIYKYIKSYSMTGYSGKLGPKREEGDGQIPEGFYRINRFNPVSKYHLSIGIDYPNKLDCMISGDKNPGKDIFIHGGNKTAGCIPIGDESIMELYIAAISVCRPFDTRVHIFPARLDDCGFFRLKREFGGDNELISFWSSLKEGYELFERNRIPVDAFPGTGGGYSFI